jgi:hypothetical protein
VHDRAGAEADERERAGVADHLCHAHIEVGLIEQLLQALHRCEAGEQLVQRLRSGQPAPAQDAHTARDAADGAQAPRERLVLGLAEMAGNVVCGLRGGKRRHHHHRENHRIHARLPGANRSTGSA